MCFESLKEWTYDLSVVCFVLFCFYQTKALRALTLFLQICFFLQMMKVLLFVIIVPLNFWKLDIFHTFFFSDDVSEL